MRTWTGVGFVLAATWVMVRGPSPGELPAEALNGAMAGLLVAFIFRRMLPGSFNPLKVLTVTPGIAIYIGIFLGELAEANLEVARRVLHPSAPVNPAVIEYPLTVEHPVAITVLANSVTLTPGTLTLDHDPGDNVLRVHAIDGAENREEDLATIERWESVLLDIFGGESR